MRLHLAFKGDSQVDPMRIQHRNPPMITCRFLSLCLSFGLLMSAFAADRPNVVVILADDFGYGSSGCYGADGKLIKTPNIDRLAQEGRRFTDANTTSSVCSPTRYSVLTGRYCWRTPLKQGVLSMYAPLHIEPGRLTVASLLKQQGYETAAVGKWHLGYGKSDGSPTWKTDYSAELSPGPLDIGFDYHFAVPANHGDLTGAYVENRFVYGLRSGKIPQGATLPGPAKDDAAFKATYTAEDTESGRSSTLELDAPKRVNERVMPLLTEKAGDWIRARQKQTPFFLYFTPVAVHNPVTPEKDLAGKSAAGLYGDWIQQLDRSVGGILKALDEAGVAQDTLVIFTSDNGGVVRLQKKDSPQTIAYEAGLKTNGVLRGSKHDIWEGGFKVPFLVRWPGKVPAGTECDEMVSLADLLATMAAITGKALPPAADAAEDSYNILPALLGQTHEKPARETMIVHSSDGVFAIRKGPWKWIEGIPATGSKRGSRKPPAAGFQPELYNTVEDVAETQDVLKQHPEVAQELSALVERYRSGGYSRELPPVVEKRKPEALPPLAGKLILQTELSEVPDKPWRITSGSWAARDGGLWGSPKAGGTKMDAERAVLRAPIELTDGTVQYEVRLDRADRHVLRFETADRKRSFRVEISRASLGLTINPAQGEDHTKALPLARKTLELEPGEWYPVKITFAGDKATVRVWDQEVEAHHQLMAEPKTALNFQMFEGAAGLRRVAVAR